MSFLSTQIKNMHYIWTNYVWQLKMIQLCNYDGLKFSNFLHKNVCKIDQMPASWTDHVAFLTFDLNDCVSNSLSFAVFGH